MDSRTASRTALNIKRLIGIFLFIVMMTSMILPLAASAEEPVKTVRVGWYESPFNRMDSTGRRSGYAYEYQLKIASYTGWNYAYINGSWPDLMKMLKDGDIDVLSDVSYTEERAEDMLFSDLSMGTEEYCIFISPDNTEITADDYSSFNGKRIGVNFGSVQIGFYREWAERHGVDAELVELSTPEAESIGMLGTGELDAYITLNAYVDPESLIPVCTIGSSDFFFAVNTSRTDILDELNDAMNRIREENPYYNLQMYDKHVKRSGSNAFLTSEESSWLASHGAIRVGYQDNYLAFCTSDPSTGEMTGALKDYFEYASTCLANAELDFETKAYPTSKAALEALKRGEIDCVFPANLSPFECEKNDLLMTPPLMNTDVYAVVRRDEQNFFGSLGHIIVAVNEGNPNYDAFLLDNFPEWRKVYYETTADCLKAVSDGVADCVLISHFRYNNISRMCERYNLVTYSTGIGLDFSLAIAEGQTELYSILDKVTGLVPHSVVSAALSYYLTEDAKLTFGDMILKNIGWIIAGISLLALVIFFLLMKSLRAGRKAKELIRITETDDLTGLYNRDYFFEYANRMYRERKETPRDAIVLNIEKFHSINELKGREFGDRVLRFIGNEVRAVAEERGGIGGRFGADRFDIYCQHTDEYRGIFERLQARLNRFAPNAGIQLRMGVMPWRENLEPVQLFDRARTACSAARGSVSEHMIVLDDKAHEKELFEQRLLSGLRRAFNNYEFEVYYQPIYDVSSDTPKVIGAEALVRWQHPELGLLAPDKFVPLFERNGKIRELDRYVCAEAAKQVACWQAQFDVFIPVSVNLSRLDIFDPDLEKDLNVILSREGLDHNAIRLEMTETAYTDNADQLIQLVKGLRESGYIVEMDDFGTGYSSLNMLSAMPIDILKMDRSFVKNIGVNQKDTQLAALIIGIARNLDIPVIAEGVETESQLRILKEQGYTLLQGFYLSRPLHPASFQTEILSNIQQQ